MEPLQVWARKRGERELEQGRVREGGERRRREHRGCMEGGEEGKGVGRRGLKKGRRVKGSEEGEE
eukprot:2210642-Rhodomonas_salina.1